MLLCYCIKFKSGFGCPVFIVSRCLFNIAEYSIDLLNIIEYLNKNAMSHI